MKSYGNLVLYGLFIWLFVFIFAVIIFPIHESNRVFFETLMPVSISFFVMLFSWLYFKKVKGDYLKSGFIAGIVWLGISLLIDAFMFSWGPMKMGFVEYMQDIGVTYLMIPIITIGIGFILEGKFKI